MHGHPPRLRHGADSAAPTRIAISSPSPVLVFTDTGWVIGPRTKERTRSRSHSKPPVARITPRARRRRRRRPPRRSGRRRPPPSVDQLPPRPPRSGLDAAVETALEQATHQPLAGAPLVVHLAAGHLLGRHARGRPRPSGVSLIVMFRPICGPTVTFSAHGPSSSKANSGHSSERPPPASLRVLGVVVGEALDDLEPDRRVGLQPTDHRRAGVDVGGGELLVDQVVGQDCR